MPRGLRRYTILPKKNLRYTTWFIASRNLKVVAAKRKDVFEIGFMGWDEMDVGVCLGYEKRREKV